MRFRRFTETDYDEICKWWQYWKFPIVDINNLPDTGFVIGDKHGDVCAAWIYKTDSPICWAEWFISNPQAKGIRRQKGMDKLLNVVMDHAKVYGFKYIYTSVKHVGLAKRLEGAGFGAMEKDMINFMKVL